jgi:hypothetical protein
MTTIAINDAIFNLRPLCDPEDAREPEARWSLTGPYGADADELEWPTDEQCSEAAGVRLETFDAGDDPHRPEAIMRVIAD